MSLSHKLLTIETSIAFEDVQDSWRFDREVWMCEVVEALNDPQRLAALTLKMLSMLTPGCVAYYWKKPSDYKRLNEAALKLASAKSDPTGKALKAIVAEVEGLILDENETEHALLSSGKPDEFAIGEKGPELHANDVCGALDIRMAWCPAQVVQRRLGPGGAVQYRVHYDGWKKRWDEWVARDSGRVRGELPATNPPRKIDGKAKAKAAKEAAKEAAKPPEKESKKGASSKKERAAASEAGPSEAVDDEDAEEYGFTKKGLPRQKPGRKSNAERASSSEAVAPSAKRPRQSEEAQKPKKKAKAGASASSGGGAGGGAGGGNGGDDEKGGVPAAPLNSAIIQVGERVNIDERLVALDCRDVWCEAKVVDLRFFRVAKNDISAVKLRYAGWGKKWDEWAKIDSGKVRRLFVPAMPPKPKKAKAGEEGGAQAEGAGKAGGKKPEGAAKAEGGKAAASKPRKAESATKAPPKPKKAAAEKEAGAATPKPKKSAAEKGAAAVAKRKLKERLSHALDKKRGKDGDGIEAKNAARRKKDKARRDARKGKDSPGGSGPGGSGGGGKGKEAASRGATSPSAASAKSRAKPKPGEPKSATPAVRMRMAGYAGREGGDRASTSSYNTRPVTSAPVRLDEDTSIRDNHGPHVPRERKKPQPQPPYRASAGAGNESEYEGAYANGDQCWARDVRNEWCHATVVSCAAGKVKVHYTGWSKKWDEWKRLDVEPPQVSQYNLYDKEEAPSAPPSVRPAVKQAKAPGGGGGGGAKRKGGGGGDGGRPAKKGREASSYEAGAGYSEANHLAAQQYYGNPQPGGEYRGLSGGEYQHPGGFDGGGGGGGGFDPQQQQYQQQPPPGGEYGQPPFRSLSANEYQQPGFDAYGAQPGDAQWGHHPQYGHPLPSGGLGGEGCLGMGGNGMGGMGSSGFGMHGQQQQQPELMLTSIEEGKQCELLRGLQLTRDFLRTLQQAPGLMQSNANFFVRLNMGSRYFLYVAAQIVQINGDELQVRGVDPNQPHFIQRTKLAYVSNAMFKDEELAALIDKLRCGVISDMRVGEVEEMMGLRQAVVQHPLYTATRQAQQQAAAAVPPQAPPPPPPTAHMVAPPQPQPPMACASGGSAPQYPPMAAPPQHQRHTLLPEEMGCGSFMQQSMYEVSNPAQMPPAGAAPSQMADRLRQGWTAPGSYAMPPSMEQQQQQQQQQQPQPGHLPMGVGTAPTGSALPVGSSLLGEMSSELPPPATYHVPPMQAQPPSDASMLLPPEC